MSGHTPEPWKAERHSLYGADGSYIGYLEGVSFEDAQRIILCVNACKNLTNGELDDLIHLDGLSLDMLEKTQAQRDTAWQELREIREAIKADENESTADEVRSLVKRLAALEDIATAVEADIDAGRPLEYNVDELRAELIRARKALGILPEQEQTTTLGMEQTP